MGAIIDNSNPDDSIFINLSTPHFISYFPDGLTKEQCEDLQIFDWINFMANSKAIHSPVSIGVGSDPPDRILTTSIGPVNLELTELTLSNIRAELAPFKRYSESVTRLLHQRTNDLPHLLGKRFHFSYTGFSNDFRRDFEFNTDKVIEALSVDIGVVDDNEFNGLPEKFPDNPKGFYGAVGDFTIQAYRHVIPNQLAVSCSCQTKFSRSEVTQKLFDLIERKDVPSNDALLITCGLPDKRGFVCPADFWIYRVIADARFQLRLNPTNLKCVILRNWNSFESVELFRATDFSLPWLPI